MVTDTATAANARKDTPIDPDPTRRVNNKNGCIGNSDTPVDLLDNRCIFIILRICHIHNSITLQNYTQNTTEHSGICIFTSPFKKNAKKTPQILELKQKDVTLHTENQRKLPIPLMERWVSG